MKKRVTFEVDEATLFEMLWTVNDGGEGLGTRLASALMAEPSTAEAIGMAVYGVVFIGYESAEPPAPEFEMLKVSKAKVEPCIQAEIDELTKNIPADAAWRERAIEACTNAVRLEWTQPLYAAELKRRAEAES